MTNGEERIKNSPLHITLNEWRSKLDLNACEISHVRMVKNEFQHSRAIAPEDSTTN